MIISPIKPKCDNAFLRGEKKTLRIIGSKTYCLTNKNFQKQFLSPLKKVASLGHQSRLLFCKNMRTSLISVLISILIEELVANLIKNDL